MIGGMITRRHREFLRTRWDALRTSFWFVPALMALGAIGVAAAVPWMDGRFGTGAGARAPWFVYVSEPDQARDLLSTLLSSMITMASLVFSITMVVLTLAAGQFGPRLIRNFMASPQTQFVLGTFVATIVYCLLALASIGWRDGEGPFAYVSVTLAIGLALASVGLLVVYVDALARSIMSETVIEQVGRELDDALAELDPLEVRERGNPEAALPEDYERRAAFFGPTRAGYVQGIEFEDIVEAAQQADVLVGLRFRAGDFVVEGSEGIGIYPGERSSDRLAEAVRRAVIVGVHRTPVQDPDFSIRHLVEIAVRALSPAINDPYTAVSVVNRLSASLSRLMGRAMPRGAYFDRDGVLRVLCPEPTYGSILGAAFDQIRQNGGDKPVIVIHLLTQREALREQVRVIVEAAERRIEGPSDLAAVGRRADRGREALDDAARKAEQKD